MANHAKVFFKGRTEPLPEAEVTAVAEEFNQKVLGGKFVVVHEPGSNYWFLAPTAGEQWEGCEFWQDTYDQYNEDATKEKDATIAWSCPCVEFRHGHGSQFMWWVDLSLEEFFGKRYGAELYDDGVGYVGKTWDMEADYTAHILKKMKGPRLSKGHPKSELTKVVTEALRMYAFLSDPYGQEFIDRGRLKKWLRPAVLADAAKAFCMDVTKLKKEIYMLEESK